MKRRSLLQVLFASMALGSCCSYKCDIVMPVAQIRLVYHNYALQAVLDAKIYLADSNYLVIDSASNTFQDSTMYIFQGLFGSQYGQFNQYNYISKIAGRSDTISAINYDVIHDQTKCGECLLNNNKQNVTRYVNVRYNYKGATRNMDSLVLYK